MGDIHECLGDLRYRNPGTKQALQRRECSAALELAGSSTFHLWISWPEWGREEHDHQTAAWSLAAYSRQRDRIWIRYCQTKYRYPQAGRLSGAGPSLLRSHDGP